MRLLLVEGHLLGNANALIIDINFPYDVIKVRFLVQPGDVTRHKVIGVADQLTQNRYVNSLPLQIVDSDNTNGLYSQIYEYTYTGISQITADSSQSNAQMWIEYYSLR